MSATIDVSAFCDTISACITGQIKDAIKAGQHAVNAATAAAAKVNFGSFQPIPDECHQTTQKGTTYCPVLEVPGVTFPVEVIWWEGNPWDPESDGAIQEFVVEVLRIFNHEQSGNILCFMSTIRSINEAIEVIRKQLKHDPDTVVLPLYAALHDWQREEVVSFTNLHKFPNNKGKRMICFSTNVAEAGVTIPGVTTVIETGREIQVTYDLDLKADIGVVGWISQASQADTRSWWARH